MSQEWDRVEYIKRSLNFSKQPWKLGDSGTIKMLTTIRYNQQNSTRQRPISSIDQWQDSGDSKKIVRYQKELKKHINKTQYMHHMCLVCLDLYSHQPAQKKKKIIEED